MDKIQKYLPHTVIGLVVLLILVKVFYNYQSNKIQWEENDREILINEYLEELEGYAVRFPSQSITYCECMADTLMAHFSKLEYYVTEDLPTLEREEIMLPITAECVSNYNAAMFDANRLEE